MNFKDYLVDVPPYQGETIWIEKFEVSQSEAEFHNLREIVNAHRGMRLIEPGEYTRLYVHGQLMMSDTPAEIRDHRTPIVWAQGRCLVNGLGLGVVVGGMLMKEKVEHVTVIELNPEVVSWVGGHYLERFGPERLTIIQADAFEWKPPKGERYEGVWHDIWPDICVDDLEGHSRLLRKYGRRCEWQGAWLHEELKRMAKTEAREIGGWY